MAIAFELSEEQKLFRQTFRRFLEKEIAPFVEEAEEKEECPKWFFKKMSDHGYLCVAFPEEYGGAGVDKVTECILREELARVSQGFLSSWSAHCWLGTYPIYTFGSEEQKQTYLIPAIKGEKIACFGLTEPNAGSDNRAMKTKAVFDGNGYVLNGSKIFITNATFCDYVVVAAYTDKSKGNKGMNLFIVEKGTPGFEVARKLKKEGIRSSETAELAFSDCWVPKNNLIGEETNPATFYDLMKVLTFGRIGVAAGCVGIAQASLEAATQYSQQREQFGRPIKDFQSISFKMADMATRIEAARLLVWQSAWLYDNGHYCVKEASMAKLFASEAAVHCAKEAVHIFGGYGMMREYPVGRYLRDALVYEIGEGTSEIQKGIIAKQLGL